MYLSDTFVTFKVKIVAAVSIYKGPMRRKGEKFKMLVWSPRIKKMCLKISITHPQKIHLSVGQSDPGAALLLSFSVAVSGLLFMYSITRAWHTCLR